MRVNGLKKLTLLQTKGTLVCLPDKDELLAALEDSVSVAVFPQRAIKR